MKITPLKKPVIATVRMPGSKSYTNRALVMAALTKGSVSLINPLYSDDTQAMIGCLRALGVEIERTACRNPTPSGVGLGKLFDGAVSGDSRTASKSCERISSFQGGVLQTDPDKIVVHGDISCVEDQNYQLFAHDSGTTLRFMLALLCIVPGIKTIQGSQRLNERPIRDLVDGLREIGASIEHCEEEGKLPVKVSSSALTGHAVHLKGDISSQFCSAILLISPYISKGFTIHITGSLISKPYIDMTMRCMRDWGVKVVAEEGGHYFVPAHQSYRKNQYVIEGDFSSAGYFFAIAALTKSTITVENLNPASAQADRKFLDILAKMGNEVIDEENRITVKGKQILPMDVDMEDCPDQVMTMAVLAAFAQGVTRISGVRSLRVKETERMVAIKNELGKMGIRTEDTHDTLCIYGGSPHAAVIDTYNDHRMAMAFAVAGMVLPGIVIRQPEVVNKTFPTFWECLGSLK